MTRTRALVPTCSGTSRSASSYVGAGTTGLTVPSWLPSSAAGADAAAVAHLSMHATGLGNPRADVRPGVAAGMGAVPAFGAAAGTIVGRKQGRPPRGEPR